MKEMRYSPVPRDRWTSTPDTVINYLAGLRPGDRRGLLRQYEKMSEGDDGGQIEPWDIHTVRSALYPGWEDSDFKHVVDAFKPTAALDITQVDDREEM